MAAFATNCDVPKCSKNARDRDRHAAHASGERAPPRKKDFDMSLFDTTTTTTILSSYLHVTFCPSFMKDEKALFSSRSIDY